MTTFTIPAAQLRTAADWVARVIPNHPPVLILGGLLVTAGYDDHITLAGFDYEQHATLTIPALSVATSGRFLLPAPFLVAVAKAAGKADLTVTADHTYVELKAGRSSWGCPVLHVEDYPELPDLGDPVGEVDAELWHTAIRRVLPAASRDMTLPMLTGVQLTSTPDTLTLAATDRYRLAVAEVEWKPTDPDAEPLNMVVPAELMGLALRAPAAGTVQLTATGSLIGMATDQRAITSRLLDVEFARWRQLLSDPGDWWARVPVGDLTRAIDQVTLADKSTSATLDVNGPDLTVKVNNSGRTAEAHCEISSSGEPISIVFNASWLKDALTAAAAGPRADDQPDEVTFHFGGPTKPALILGPDPTYRHLLMPIREPGA